MFANFLSWGQVCFLQRRFRHRERLLYDRLAGFTYTAFYLTSVYYDIFSIFWRFTIKCAEVIPYGSAMIVGDLSGTINAVPELSSALLVEMDGVGAVD